RRTFYSYQREKWRCSWSYFCDRSR
ncbi:DNA gyrase, A subunit, partial [Chlamydia psittaci 02DC14]